MNPLTVQLDVGGTWHITIFFCLSLILVNWISNFKIPLEYKLLWAYVAVYALYFLEYPRLHFGDYTLAYQMEAGRTLAEVILIPVGAMMFRKQALKILPYVVVFTLACVWLKRQGLMNAPSFNSAFCAAAIPLLPWWAILATLATVLTHHGSTALLIVGAQLLPFAWRRKKVFLALPILLFIAWNHSGAMFDATDRLQHYRTYMEFWMQSWRNIFIGVGPGTFVVKSPEMSEYKGQLFLQMHSDWLQILWELGAVGLLLSIAATWRAIRNARNISALLGCAAFAVSYHPLRYFPTAFLIAIIFSYTANSSAVRQSIQSNHLERLQKFVRRIRLPLGSRQEQGQKKEQR